MPLGVPSLLVLALPLLHCVKIFHPDKVLNLPGTPTTTEFDLFAGYLNGSSNAADIPIFYVLAEAIRVEAISAPLIVWFNGGPGGSSLYGFFTENGPFRIAQAGDSLTYNEFSWNQYANVLYLESPLGVGFSQNSKGDVTPDDVAAAEVNFNALRDFMTRVHRRYIDRDYFLSGQSYAGAYVPYLARRLLQGIDSGEMENSKFKGFAIGSPTFNSETAAITVAMAYVGRGLASSKQQETIMNSWLTHQKRNSLNSTDFLFIKNFIEDVDNRFLGYGSPVIYNLDEHCYDHAVTLPDEEFHRPTEEKSVACFGKHSLELYMNRKDVLASLHVNINRTKDWAVVNGDFHSKFNRSYDVLPIYDDIFKLLNGSSFRILIYNGDTDAVLPVLHAIQSVSKIATANSLMGAGHSVPRDLPAQAFQIINNFIFTEDSKEVRYSDPIRKRSTKQALEKDESGSKLYVILISLVVIGAVIGVAFVWLRMNRKRRNSPIDTEGIINYHEIEDESQIDLLPV